jgi:uncharacterized protein YjbJ (UPF0337 family)
MTSTTDKIKGMANKAACNIKRGISNLVGSDKMQAKGKDPAKDTANKPADTINKQR